jgi:hypothetical protein
LKYAIITVNIANTINPGVKRLKQDSFKESLLCFLISQYMLYPYRPTAMIHTNIHPIPRMLTIPVRNRNRIIPIVDIGNVSSKVLFSFTAAKKLKLQITATNNKTASTILLLRFKD